MRLIKIFCLILISKAAVAQSLKGIVVQNNNPVPYINVMVVGTKQGTTSKENGTFELKNINVGKQILEVSGVGFVKKQLTVNVLAKKDNFVNIEIEEDNTLLNQVTVSATLKERVISESPAPIEILSPSLFRKAASTNIYDAMNMVNGVRPQLNCNVCNTGDIHINGMEGGYTMIMIDGMPIVSSLSTVYGLFGIPNNIIERVEIMKGPASTLYGSEAVGGLINIITKKPENAPKFNFDISTNTYSEHNIDVATRFRFKKATSLLSANLFGFNKRFDINHDNFTDITLQKRASVFNKWQIILSPKSMMNVAFRGIIEDRFGGELQWQKKDRGGNEIYGESIETKRLELIGNYQKSNLKLQFSYNLHHQNSAYGNAPYLAMQRVAFLQALWDKQFAQKHDAVLGLALRHTFYDDNTSLTKNVSRVFLPGIFVQDEIKINSKNNLLAGLRLDYNSEHGTIFSPRVNWKYSPNKENTLRLSYGNGFRVVNLFSEEGAFNGSREVVIAPILKPERSHNINLNYAKTITHSKGYVNLESSVFYTYFNNKIVADYDTDDNKVFFDNLQGYGVSRGAALNLDFSFTNSLKILAGATAMNVFQVMNNEVSGLKSNVWQIQTPKFTANWAISYTFGNTQLSIDYTGNLYSPMRLPILQNDFRPEFSPWFSLHHLQFTKRFTQGLQLYGGIKNLGNFIPKYPIMRANDPFDKHINDLNPNSPYYNPKGYTFDPNYNYAPIQKIRGFVGLRWSLY